jgi:RHS repeat-associated protein
MTGRRSGAAYANVAFLYDLAGRDTSRAVNLYGAGGILRTRTQYDGAGRVRRLTTTSTQGAWYDFDARDTGRYDAADVLRSYVFSEPAVTGGPGSNRSGDLRFNYDSVAATGRLLQSLRTDLVPAAYTDYTWTYDVFGNRVSEICSGGCDASKRATFGPDHTLRSTFDTLSLRSAVYWTDRAGNRLVQTDSVSHLPIASPSTLLSYTALSQLYFAMTPTAQVGTYDYTWHWYDGQGRRVVTHAQQGSSWTPGVAPNLTSGTRYYYVYEGADVAIVLAHSGSQWWVHQRILSGGVDQALAGWFYNNGGSSSGALALVADQQGSVRAAVKPDGNRDELAPYFGRNAWGALEGASGTGGGSTQTNTQTGYTGASSPTVTGGFTYLRNRWYDPATGRFLTQDPIGLAGGVNLYAYAGNNPVSFGDPFGLCPPELTGRPCLGPVNGQPVTASSIRSDAWSGMGYGRNHATRAHQGVDLLAAPGTSVTAADAGTVYETGTDKNYGNYIILQHSNAAGQPVSYTRYAHLQSVPALDDETSVAAGQAIGVSGTTGNAAETTPHVHFEITTSPHPGPGLAGRCDPVRAFAGMPSCGGADLFGPGTFRPDPFRQR